MICKQKCLLLFLLIPTVMGQNISDLLNDINQLYVDAANYEFPTNYSEFYREHFNNAGIYGIYDFIIVGAGSAGTLLADELSKIKEWNILLLEAGQNETEYTDVPALAPMLQFTDFNWGFQSTNQTNSCLGMTDHKCKVPRGKALGGSSVINFMMYVRGNKHDYDQWNVSGWSYDDVLPYFLQVENSSLVGNVDQSYHHTGGDLSVEFVRYFTDFAQDFLNGAEEEGYKILDYNGKDQMGFSRLQSNTILGRRDSGNKAFLNKAQNRKNLHIQKGAFVTELIMSEEIVTGVKFVVGNRSYIAHARIEVILSAGAVGSPQLLMLSGVGPKKDLESLKIKVLQDLPVGSNLHDHLTFIYFFSSNYTLPQQSVPETLQDYLNGQGYFTAAANIEALGFTNSQNSSASYPDIEHIFIPFFDATTPFLSNGLGLTADILSALLKPFPLGAPVILTTLLHSKSRGTIKLATSNPFDHPLIDLNFLAYEEDLDTMLNGFNNSLKLITSKLLQKYNISLPVNPIPECEMFDFFTTDYIKCLIKHISISIYHLAGTCKMGDNKKTSVVNSKLKVHGFKNLRVVDASIIPSQVSGHTNAPAYMIALKASDLIKREYGKPCILPF